MTKQQTGAPIDGTREETLDPHDWAAMRAARSSSRNKTPPVLLALIAR